MTQPIIRFEGGSKAFGTQTVLRDFSLDVEPGAFVSIIGRSGCGKTTVLKLVNGLLSPDTGRVLIQGQDVARIDPVALRRRIGMVFQSYELFPHLTVMDNILLAPCKVLKKPREQVREEARALLGRVGLLEKEDQYPRQLSGGQKQRVAIVRALCMHPEILLFDEVTAALDPEMVREVLDVMLGLAREGKTMVIVTHEMQFARAIADRVLFLDGGVVAEEAPPEQFFRHPQTQRARQFLNMFEFDAVKAPKAETAESLT